ncbi:MAG: type VI secretion system Vgr family protein [Nannocystales bacterium]
MSELFSAVGTTLTVAGYEVREVGEISYEEELNSPFKLSVFCVLEVGRDADGASINRGLRHREIHLRIERKRHESSALEIRGMVANAFHADVRKDETDDSRSRKAFTLEVVPAFALLEHHKDKPQAWHNRTHSFVLQQVLEAELAVYGRTVQNKAKPGPTIPLITRSPGESALAFVQRLLYESGINSFFDHDAGAKEVLVLADDNSGFKTPKLPYEDRISLTDSEGADFVHNVRHSAQSGPSSTEFGGFDPVQSPNLNIGQLGQGDSTLPAGAKELRWTAVRHGEDGSPDSPYKASAERHAERAATAQNSFEFDTSILGGLAGRVMPLDQGGTDVDAVVTSVKFSSKDGTFSADTKVAPTRSSTGEAVQVRAPAERPPTQYNGLSLARVASSGAAVDVDGRLWCKIKYVWDTEGKDEPQTRAPVMQPMAGAYGGTQWIPRKGDVVIVAFLEGSRENPVIIGCQYDAKQSPLHIGPADTPGHMSSEAKSGAGTQLPSSASWLGWSHSSIAGSRPSSNARTMFAMNVAEGSELLYLGAPRDYRVDVTRNADFWVKGEATRKVETDLKEEVGANYEQKVGVKSDVEIGANYNLKVGGNGTLDLGKAGGITAKSALMMDTTGAMTCTAGSFRVDSPSISFSSKPSVGGGMGAATGESGLVLKQRTELFAPDSAALLSGPSSVEASPRKVSLDSAAIELQSSSGCSTKLENGKVVVDAPDGIVLRCGDTEISLSSKGIEISGGSLEIKIRGESTVTSDRIKLEGESLSIENDQTRIAAKRLDISD